MDLSGLNAKLTQLFTNLFERLAIVETPSYTHITSNVVDGDSFTFASQSHTAFNTLFMSDSVVTDMTIPDAAATGPALEWRNDFPIGATMRGVIGVTGYAVGGVGFPKLTLAVGAGDMLKVPDGKVASITGDAKQFTLTRLDDTVWLLGGDLDNV